MSLLHDFADGVLRLTLDRPEKRNAFDETLIAALTAAYRDAGANDRVRAVVLQAKGSHFSSGGDLAWMGRMAEYDAAENLADARRLADLMRSIDRCPKPTLARVQGPAFAGAVGLLACCDIVVAAPEALFAITEVKIGLIPAVISPYILRAIGIRQARRWCLTAESFSAEQALAMGLIHQIAPAEQLDQTLQTHLTALSLAGPQALAATKALLAAVDRPLDDDVIADTARRIAEQRAGSEGREGINAFLAKRSPSWRAGR
jgi:methylglutaconyl-CoA hydratase